MFKHRCLFQKSIPIYMSLSERQTEREGERENERERERERVRGSVGGWGEKAWMK